ncbi:MAG TPA: hypothetical protein VM888_10160 [Chitinophagaceae bacterium]|nr:hypothetical protein [Chitinophagaceae bacterium]
MKKTLGIFLILSLIVFSGFTCNKSAVSTNKSTNCYKGRLEVKGICLNYTIKVLDGNIDKSLIVENWKDENTGKVHQNVFALASQCSFPSNLKEGDEFYFTIDNNAVENCAVCKAFYPVPPKRLSIAVTTTGCN